MNLSIVNPSAKGRKHFQEDIWAHEQVNIYKRPTLEVRREWKSHPKVTERKLINPDRQFQRIIKSDWLKRKTNHKSLTKIESVL